MPRDAGLLARLLPRTGPKSQPATDPECLSAIAVLSRSRGRSYIGGRRLLCGVPVLPFHAAWVRYGPRTTLDRKAALAPSDARDRAERHNSSNTPPNFSEGPAVPAPSQVSR